MYANLPLTTDILLKIKGTFFMVDLLQEKAPVLHSIMSALYHQLFYLNRRRNKVGIHYPIHNIILNEATNLNCKQTSYIINLTPVQHRLWEELRQEEVQQGSGSLCSSARSTNSARFQQCNIFNTFSFSLCFTSFPFLLI